MANQEDYQELDLIEEITRNDETKYYEIGNIFLNGRAELAAENGLIKEVKILKLNIPHSTAVEYYEKYINENYETPHLNLDNWTEVDKSSDKVKNALNDILTANGIKDKSNNEEGN